MQLARVNPTLPLRSFHHRARLPIVSTSNLSIPRKKTRERGREGDLLFVRLAFPELDPLFPKRRDTPLTRALVHRVQFGKFEKITIGFFLLSSFFLLAAETKQRDKCNAFLSIALSTRLDDVDTNFPISVTNHEYIGFH